MTGIIGNPTEMTLYMVCGLTELVRGQDQELLDELTPIVRERSVALDLCQVERIDAAGIAALISLYGRAHEAGHEFKVVNAQVRVTEILAIVGLDRILVSQNVVPCSHSADCFAQSAA